jgi:hypothetical protein
MKKTLLAILTTVSLASSSAYAQFGVRDWEAQRILADSVARSTAEATAVVYGGWNSQYPPVVQQAMISRNTINAWYDTMNANPNLPYNGAYGAYIGPSPARCAPMYVSQPVIVPVVIGGGCGGGGWGGPGGAIGFGAGAAAIGYGAQNYNYSNTNWGIGINAGVGGNSGSFGRGGFGNTNWGIGINTGIGGNSGSFRSW